MLCGDSPVLTRNRRVVPRRYHLCSARSGRRDLQGTGPEVGTGLAWEGSGPGRETLWHETRWLWSLRLRRAGQWESQGFGPGRAAA